MAQLLKQFSELLKSSDLRHSAKFNPEIGILIKGDAHYLVDLKNHSVQAVDKAEAPPVMTFKNRDVAVQILAMPEKAWSMAMSKNVWVTDRVAALVLLEELFPGTLQKKLGKKRFVAMFPHLVKIDYPGSTEVFFNDFALRLLKENGHMLQTVSAAFEFHIEGAGIWTVDVTGEDQIYEGLAKDPSKAHSITTSRAVFEEILADDSKAWPHFNSQKITVSNACRASQIVQTLWPRAFPKAMPAALYHSLFPETLRDAAACEYNKTEGVYTTYVGGKKGEYIPIKYSGKGDLAIYEGDIILGTIKEMENIRKHVEGKSGLMPEGFRIINWNDPSQYLWPGGVVYYEVADDPTADPAKKVKDAMDHWVEKTNITFKKRTTEANYVSVKEGDGCSATIGMVGGEQSMTLSKNCSVGNIIHEIGHTVGLFHEQCRQDRDDYVTIKWDQIEDSKEDNFEIPSSDISEDMGGYDYSSIMHYGKDAFAKGKDPTIVPKEDVEIGQRDGLSEDDIATILEMYP